MITSPSSLSPEEICVRIKHFGYSISARIRIYGEEFEVLSDPFPQAGGFAIHVRSSKTQKMRALQLPATIIQRVSERMTAAVRPPATRVA